MLQLLLILALMQPGSADEAVGAGPDSFPGLVAHYDADALHRRLRDGEGVHRWEDLSGNGHDLVAISDYEPALYRVAQLGGMPVVEIREHNQFEVQQPFELADHTIFLVHSARHNQSALFSSDSDARRGLRLALGGRTHSYQVGKQGDAHYNEPRSLSLDYGITVLGRKAGVMKAALDGVDYSSNTPMNDPVRVGRLFHMRHSTYVTSNGEGLKIAEMIFYDRFLEKSERGSVTDFLADKYGIQVEQTTLPRKIVEPGMQFEMDASSALASMTSHSEDNLNGDVVPIEWRSDAAVSAPLEFDAEIAPAELRCKRDATRVRLKIAIPLVTSDAGTRLRGFFLRNAEEYHPEETDSGPFSATENGYAAEIRLSTTMTLDAGEFIEFVVSRAGGDGEVRIGPAGARLLIEPLD